MIKIRRMEADQVKLVFRYIIWYMHLIIYVFGTSGNIVSFLVFSRKKFQNTVFSIYFRILAVTDSFTIFFSINEFIKYQLNIKLEYHAFILCKSILYLVFIFGPMSAHLLVVISYENFSLIKSILFQFYPYFYFQFLDSIEC
jgi:hypothetical protein